MTIQIPAIERRVCESAIELRASDSVDEPAKIRGYAARFNSFSENLGSEEYSFREIIEPGAFDTVLLDDTRALFNHDANWILARSKNGRGTLELGSDEIGLWYAFQAPATQAGTDLLTAIRRGDIDQSSFAFSVNEDGQEWEVTEDENGHESITRRIKHVSRLYDVSPVTYPAYPDTTVAVRSLKMFRTENLPALTGPTKEQLSEVLDWAARFGQRI